MEIKFRGMPLNSDKWVYGNYIKIVGKDFVEHHITSFSAWEDNVKVIPETVSQYTGLMDINNNEIYANNLLQDTRTKHVFRVYSLDGGFAIKSWAWRLDLDFNNGDELIMEDLVSIQNQSYISDNCEIVGSVHEFPDKLEMYHE